MNQNKSVEINEDFESILICAARYAIGRKTYMPHVVVGYILPLLPNISTKSLSVLKNDLDIKAKEYESSVYKVVYGDEDIDKPLWVNLKAKIEEEIEKRGR